MGRTGRYFSVRWKDLRPFRKYITLPAGPESPTEFKFEGVGYEQTYTRLGARDAIASKNVIESQAKVACSCSGFCFALL